jgi:hypothetical protein
MKLEDNGVPFYTGTLEENKEEKIERVKTAFVYLCEGAYPDLQMQLGGLESLAPSLTKQMQGQGIAALARRQDLIAEVNACTTVEQVWAVNIDYTNLNAQTVSRTNISHLSGAPNTALSNAETRIGTALTITPSHANAKIKLECRVDLTKDSGTTVREATIAIRRGDSDTAPLVGVVCIVRSQGVASSKYGPAVIFEVDEPATTGAVTYTVRGVLGAGVSTATRATLTATEI